MNNRKLFDKCQIILMMISIPSLIISLVLNVFLMNTATKQIIEEKEVIVYNPYFQSFFLIFYFIHLTALIWFVIRLFTYKLRSKESNI